MATENLPPVERRCIEPTAEQLACPSAFVGMVTTPEYQALSGHRTAALADSRLVPTTG